MAEEDKKGPKELVEHDENDDDGKRNDNYSQKIYPLDELLKACENLELL